MDTAAVPIPTRLFRAMRKDESGRPRLGSQGSMLGARPGVDIHLDAASLVQGGTGGMSVTPDNPLRLPVHVRPLRLGGIGKLPVFELHAARLGERLAYRADPKAPDRHGFIEPSQPMSFDSYQAAIAQTQSSWTEMP